MPTPSGAGAGPQLPDPGPAAGQAAGRARRIVSQPAYHHRGTGRSLIQRILDWIGRHLPQGRSSTPHGSLPSWLSVVVLFVFVALVLVGLFFLVRYLARRGFRARARKRKQETEPVEDEVEVTPLRTTDEWQREAERMEAGGRWREALRARYRSIVGRLIDRGLLDDQPGRTPGEHRLELADAAPPAAPPFDAATAMFEATWYGDEPTDQDALARFRALVDAVSAGVDEAEATATAKARADADRAAGPDTGSGPDGGSVDEMEPAR